MFTAAPMAYTGTHHCIGDLIRLHSKVLVRGMIVENPLHLTPDELLVTSGG
jgi:hypothetical protein